MVNLDDDERINVPILYIDYRERRNNYIKESFPLAEISFITDFRMDIKGIWYGTKVGFWIAIIGCFLLCSVMTCLQFNRPALSEDYNERCVNMVIKALVNTFDMLSRCFFMFLFAVTGYLFIFFKMQERVHTFLPGIDV